MQEASETVVITCASADITPRFPVALAGYSSVKDLCGKADMPLKANGIRFCGNETNPMLISLDVLFTSRELRQTLLAYFKGRIEDHELFLCATHTHFAPAIDRTKPMLGKVDERYVESVFETVIGLVEKLLTAPPVVGTVHYGEQFAEHAINRRRPVTRPTINRRRIIGKHVRLAPYSGGMKDERVRAIVIKNNGGEPAGIIWNYACHPVNEKMGTTVTSEYPGAVRSYLQERWSSDLVVVFLQGFAGDIRPKHEKRRKGIRRLLKEMVRGPSFPAVSENEKITWNKTLSERVGDAVEMAMSARGVETPVFARRIEVQLQDIVTTCEKDRRISFGRLDLGNRISFVFISAEVVVEYQAYLKSVFAGRYVVPVGYTDDVFGYLPTSRMIKEGGYEACGFFHGFSLKAGFEPDFENRIKDTLAELARKEDETATTRVYTVAEIEAGIRDLGLKKGDNVLVRAGLRAVGNVERRRSSVLLRAIRNVIGPEGTLLGCAFNSPNDREEVMTPSTIPYTGGFVREMLSREEAIRSLHPSNSFVAIGPRAEDFLSGHDERATCHLPVENLLASNGKMIVVGCVESSPGFSTVHLVQEKLRLSYGNYRKRRPLKYERGGEIKIFKRKDVPGCSRGFGKFYQHYIRKNKLRMAHVGDALSYCVDCRDAFEIEYEVLKKDPTYALCNNKDCYHCRASLTYNMRDLPGYYGRRGWHKVVRWSAKASSAIAKTNRRL